MAIEEGVLIINDSIFSLFIVVIVLSICGTIIGNKVKKMSADDEPSKLILVMEMLVETIQALVKSNMGARNLDRFSPYIFTLTCFLAVANLLGLVGLTSPTSDYSVTLALALITFALTQFWKYRNNKGILGYLKSFTKPMMFLTPLNILGELANPISLSFRLFGNVMSGAIIMTLLYHALGWIAPIATPVLHGYFDVFSGLLQTFIFIMLTMIFIGGEEVEE